VLWGYVVQPMLATFLASVQDASGFTLKYYKGFFNLSSTQMEALLTTVGISVASVITCAIVGVSMAVLLNRFEFPGRRLLESLILVPMALPPLIGIYAFQFLYSSSGIVPGRSSCCSTFPRFPSPSRG
jgi:hypothetical protein